MRFRGFDLRRVFTLILVLLLVSNQTLALTVALPEAAGRISAFTNDWPE